MRTFMFISIGTSRVARGKFSNAWIISVLRTGISSLIEKEVDLNNFTYTKYFEISVKPI